jgi:uncharacterized protein (TIGR03083 family)
MVVHITEDNWALTRAALRRTSEAFANLVTSLPAARAMATKDWTAADTVAHVTTLARMCAALVDPNGTEAFDGGAVLLRDTVVDTVDAFNEVLLGRFPERRAEALTASLRADVDKILNITDGRDPAEALAWLGGSKVPLAGVLAHLLNEFQIHGRDVASPARRPWHVQPEEAALFFELFLVGVSEYGYGGCLRGTGPRRRAGSRWSFVRATPHRWRWS